MFCNLTKVSIISVYLFVEIFLVDLASCLQYTESFVPPNEWLIMENHDTISQCISLYNHSLMVYFPIFVVTNSYALLYYNRNELQIIVISCDK